MSIIAERLEYILQSVSNRQVLNETGIDARSQREILTGEYEPTGLTRSYVNRLYQQTSYSNMRDTGFSHSQALRFSNQMPDSIIEKTNNVSELISRLAGGAAKNKLEKQGIQFDVYTHRALLEEMEDAIKQGLEHSRETYETWIDYGRK